MISVEVLPVVLQLFTHRYLCFVLIGILNIDDGNVVFSLSPLLVLWIGFNSVGTPYLTRLLCIKFKVYDIQCLQKGIKCRKKWRGKHTIYHETEQGRM